MQSLNEIIKAPLRLLGQFEVEIVIIGGVAATLYGSAQITNDLDVCYARNPTNLQRLASALKSVHARLRGAPDNLPFVLDAETLRKGLNVTLITDIGTLDLLGQVRGVGYYEEVVAGSTKYELFGYWFPVIEIGKLIVAKQIAGRPKDQVVLPELEAVQERLMIEQSEKG